MKKIPLVARDNQFKYFPNLANEIIELEKDYGKFCFVPLDIPCIKHNDFANWYFEKAIPITRIFNDKTSDALIGSSPFLSVDYTEWKVPEKTKWDINVQDDLFLQFPSLREQILDYFPFKELHWINIWSSYKSVQPHRDDSYYFDTPLSFRLMIHDENPKPTLFFLDQFNQKHYPDWGETNSFVFNNLRLKHGSSYNPAYRKCIFVFWRYVLDIKKYRDLLERSISKFQDKLVIDASPTSNYIDYSLE